MNIFNLNDPGWGRSGGNQGENNNSQEPQKPKNDSPPDLDQVWNDFNNRIKTFLGGNKSNRNNGGIEPPKNNKPGHGFGSFSPKFARFGIVLVVLVALALWLVSGFYIVREGQVGVVTQFGRYTKTVTPGFQWHVPAPVQAIDIVDVSQVRSFTVGYRDSTRNKVLPEALMLTEDENIVDLQFNVQYRLKPIDPTNPSQHSAAANYLFSLVQPDESVRQAAETAMREVVGKQSMNNILYESRTAAANDVMKLMQNILNSYNSGIEITTVAIQNVQPPEQVQAAFDDAIKAGQDNERQKNEAYAYSSKVVPEAEGQASRMTQEAEGYKARVIGLANGEASRFLSIESAYAKSPKVTRDRLYLSTMENVLANTSVVLTSGKGANNLTLLPLDKLIQNAASVRSTSSSDDGASMSESKASPAQSSNVDSTTSTDSRSTTDRSRSFSRN